MVVLDVDVGSHQPGFRAFLVRGEAWAYWTVHDGAYEPVELADVYLRRLRFGSGMALGTTRMYASNLALFFEFCLATGRSLRRAALELDRFMHYLVVSRSSVAAAVRGSCARGSGSITSSWRCASSTGRRSRAGRWMGRCWRRCFGSSVVSGFRRG